MSYKTVTQTVSAPWSGYNPQNYDAFDEQPT